MIWTICCILCHLLISQCSGSHLVTLYPVYHAVREVWVHGIWQTHLNTGRVQSQIKALIQNILLIKWQLVIHKLFVTVYFCGGTAYLEKQLRVIAMFQQTKSLISDCSFLPFWCMLCLYDLTCGFADLMRCAPMSFVEAQIQRTNTFTVFKNTAGVSKKDWNKWWKLKTQHFRFSSFQRISGLTLSIVNTPIF